MRFTLILATLGRRDELRRLLHSLREQTHRDFELIVVDQNADGRAADVIRELAVDMVVRRVHVPELRGLSRARNLGLRQVTGDVVAFPDDDCWYMPDSLRKAAAFFGAHPDVHVLAGKAVNEDGGAMLGGERPGPVNRWNVWRQTISYTLFFRRQVVEKIGAFDEQLGVGAGTPWGSGEETDYVLRALEAGFSVRHEPEILVGHPQFGRDARALAARAHRYGAGSGRVVFKHGYPFWFVASQWLGAMGAVAGYALLGHARIARSRLARLTGRISGWLSGRRVPAVLASRDEGRADQS